MKKIHLIVLILFAMLTFSCEREPVLHYLSEKDSLMIPYQLGDKIHFTNRQGDTIRFDVVEDETRWDVRQGDSKEQYRYVVLRRHGGRNRFRLELFGRHDNLDWGNGLLKIFDYENDCMAECRFNDRVGFRGGITYDTLTIGGKVYRDVVSFSAFPGGRLYWTYYYNAADGLLQVEESRYGRPEAESAISRI